MHQRCPFFFLGVKSVLQSLCPWLWNSLLNKISSTNWPTTVRLYSIPQSWICPDFFIFIFLNLARNGENQTLLVHFLLVSSIAPSQHFSQCVHVLWCPFAKTIHLVLQLGIDPRQEERELVAVINQEWDKEKSTIMLFTLNLHLIHLVNPRHTQETWAEDTLN